MVQEYRHFPPVLFADQQDPEPSVRENIARYIDEFYEIFGDPREVERRIIGECQEDL